MTQNSETPYCETQCGGMECGRPVGAWGHQCKNHDPDGKTWKGKMDPTEYWYCDESYNVPMHEFEVGMDNRNIQEYLLARKTFAIAATPPGMVLVGWLMFNDNRVADYPLADPLARPIYAFEDKEI